MRYVCTVCGYVYDDAKEKVPFAELPDMWTCPLCGAPKSAFVPEEPKEEKPKTVTETPKESRPAPVDDDMQQLSDGQLAALFTNLARGCEKQYKPAEEALFKEIADYYASVAEKKDGATVGELAELLKTDISEKYPAAKETAKSEGDRGAMRSCVWGEKVTRMLSALSARYASEGDAMLKNTQIWVCTVCGFVYVGEKAPERCPVCGVPSWKFEKVEGRQKA